VSRLGRRPPSHFGARRAYTFLVGPESALTRTSVRGDALYSTAFAPVPPLMRKWRPGSRRRPAGKETN